MTLRIHETYLAAIAMIGISLGIGAVVGALAFHSPTYPLCDRFVEWTEAANSEAVDSAAIGQQIADELKARIAPPAGEQLRNARVLSFLCTGSTDVAAESAEKEPNASESEPAAVE